MFFTLHLWTATAFLFASLYKEKGDNCGGRVCVCVHPCTWEYVCVCVRERDVEMIHLRCTLFVLVVFYMNRCRNDVAYL